LLPVVWLDDGKREDGAVFGGLGEGGVVFEAEVALEP
jgi:hypothetical protein